MGGEKSDVFRVRVAGEGSPPRRRGKGLDFLLELLQLGITPAWAGKRRCQLSTYTVVWDHPRVGGEKQKFLAVLGDNQGSPPHGRGKDHTGDKAACLDRITPARAGKRSEANRDYRVERDHPRVGGEKGGAWWIIILFLGSPPRGRGKARHLSHGLLPCG